MPFRFDYLAHLMYSWDNQGFNCRLNPRKRWSQGKSALPPRAALSTLATPLKFDVFWAGSGCRTLQLIILYRDSSTEGLFNMRSS